MGVEILVEPGEVVANEHVIEIFADMRFAPILHRGLSSIVVAQL
jgi:hypothetical protein